MIGNVTQSRLDYLKGLLKAEEGCSDRSQSYIDDLNVSIRNCEKSLKDMKDYRVILGAT